MKPSSNVPLNKTRMTAAVYMAIFQQLLLPVEKDFLPILLLQPSVSKISDNDIIKYNIIRAYNLK